MSVVQAATIATRATEILLAISLGIQSIEHLATRTAWSDAGFFARGVLADEVRTLPWSMRIVFAYTFRERAFLSLLVVRVALCTALALGLSAMVVPLWLSQFVVNGRFRGNYNGGSDAMTMLVLSALSLRTLCGNTPLAQKAALLFVAVQLTLSYFTAGVVKLKEGAWWRGEALHAFATTGPYGAPFLIRSLVATPRRARFPSWLVIAFECAFPLAWCAPQVAVAFLLLGVVFHLGNVLLFGLNRFLWAWLAAYPALWYASTLLAQPR